MAVEHFDLGAGVDPHPWNPALGRAWLEATARYTFGQFIALSAAEQGAELVRVTACLWNSHRAYNLSPPANLLLDQSLRRDWRDLKASYWSGWAASLGHPGGSSQWATSFLWPNAPGPRRTSGGTPTPISVPGPLGGLVPFRGIVPPNWGVLHPDPQPPLVPGSDVYDPATTSQAAIGEIPQGYLREETLAMGWDARSSASNAYGLVLVDAPTPVLVAEGGARNFLGDRAARGAGSSATWAFAQPGPIPNPESVLYFLPERERGEFQRLYVVPTLVNQWSILMSAAEVLRTADPRVMLIASMVMAMGKTAYAMLAWGLGSDDQQAAAHEVLARAYRQQDAAFATENTTYALVGGTIAAVVTAVNPVAGMIVGAAVAVGGAVLSLFESHRDTRLIDWWGRYEPVLEHAALYDAGTFGLDVLPTPDGYADPGPLFPGDDPLSRQHPKAKDTAGSSAGKWILGGALALAAYRALTR